MTNFQNILLTFCSILSWNKFSKLQHHYNITISLFGVQKVLRKLHVIVLDHLSLFSSKFSLIFIRSGILALFASSVIWKDCALTKFKSYLFDLPLGNTEFLLLHWSELNDYAQTKLGSMSLKPKACQHIYLPPGA